MAQPELGEQNLKVYVKFIVGAKIAMFWSMLAGILAITVAMR